MTPDEELVPFFKQAKEINPNVAIICSITGTDKDPQNRAKVNRITSYNVCYTKLLRFLFSLELWFFLSRERT